MIMRLNLFVGAFIGGVAVFFIMQAVYALWIIPKAREAGRAEERTAAISRSMEILKERHRTNATVSALTDPDICKRLGGIWVQDAKRCD